MFNFAGSRVAASGVPSAAAPLNTTRSRRADGSSWTKVGSYSALQISLTLNAAFAAFDELGLGSVVKYPVDIYRVCRQIYQRVLG